MLKTGNLPMILENACLEIECYWHTSHYSKAYRNGCIKYTDTNYCKGCETIEEVVKREFPDDKEKAELVTEILRKVMEKYVLECP